MEQCYFDYIPTEILNLILFSIPDVKRLVACSERTKNAVMDMFNYYMNLYEELGSEDLILKLASADNKDAIVFLINNTKVDKDVLLEQLLLSKNTKLIKYFIGYNEKLINGSIKTNNVELFKWIETINNKLDYNLLSLKAVNYNSIDIIKYFLEKNVLSASMINDLIIRSAKLGFLEMIKVLLNKYNGIDFYWIAAIAAKNNKTDILKYIIEKYNLRDVHKLEDVIKHALKNKSNESVVFLFK